MAERSPPPPFNPPWWLRGPHAQTLGGKFLRSDPNLPVERVRLETPDGDFLDLDVGPEPGDPEGAAVQGKDPVEESQAPVALVLHGLEGSSRRAYVTHAGRSLLEQGIRPVAMNFRGCSGEPNRLPRAYHSGETGDLDFVLRWLSRRFPGRPLGAVGFSLGGNVLLKYLGERDGTGAFHSLESAVAVSVPFDLEAGARQLESGPMTRLYSEYFLRSLREKLLRKQALLESRIDFPRALAASTIREFDERVTAVLHGFGGASHYYRASSSLPLLGAIRTPTLLIHSRDDPFLPPETPGQVEAVSNSHLTLAFTDRGGHVGFVGRKGEAADGSSRYFWSEDLTGMFTARILRSPRSDMERDVLARGRGPL